MATRAFSKLHGGCYFCLRVLYWVLFLTTDITTHGRDDWGESPQSTSRIRHEVMQAEREFFICANSL